MWSFFWSVYCIKIEKGMVVMNVKARKEARRQVSEYPEKKSRSFKTICPKSSKLCLQRHFSRQKCGPFWREMLNWGFLNSGARARYSDWYFLQWTYRSPSSVLRSSKFDWKYAPILRTSLGLSALVSQRLPAWCGTKPLPCLFPLSPNSSIECFCIVIIVNDISRC